MLRVLPDNAGMLDHLHRPDRVEWARINRNLSRSAVPGDEDLED